jgi:hypothetical protein
MSGEATGIGGIGARIALSILCTYTKRLPKSHRVVSASSVKHGKTTKTVNMLIQIK